jgi:hypothetical protein
VVVSTTALWQGALEDRSRGQGLRNLLRNLSLLLIVVAAALLGLALAGPQWLARTSESADTVVIVDVSASMKTRSGAGTTRFDEALAEAARIVEGLPRDGRMLVMASGRKAVLQTGFESDRDALTRALAALRAGDEAGRPREAVTLALSLLRGRGDGRIYFLTDGAFDPDVDPGSPQLEFRVVGKPARNVAITRFDFRPEPGGVERFQVLLTVRNYTDSAVVAPAAVRLDDRVLFRRALELPAHEERSLVLAFPGRALGQAVARIDVEDDLAADNAAYAAVDASEPLRVLLYTRGNFYLESALAALPDVELERRAWSPAEDLASLAQARDVVVLDGVEAPRLPPGNFLLVDSTAQGLPFSAAGRVNRPAIAGHGASALMREVDLTAVRIEEARRVVLDEPVAGLQRLFWSSGTELALALLDGGLRLVYVGFDLARSNFPLQAAFPVFVSQSLEWLRPRGDGLRATHIAAGEARPIRVPVAAAQVTVRAPSGGSVTLDARDGSALFGATAEAGIYRYTTGGAERYFAVTAGDARESDVNNRSLPGERRPAAPAADGARTLVPLWPWLLAAVLALLALEWLVWTRNRGHA